MGGKLLNLWNLAEKRVSRADFDRIVEDVLRKLRSNFPNRRVEPLKFFSDKQDFGDVDVAFEVFSDSPIVDFPKDLEVLFGHKPHKNGNCISFPVEGFQVDILLFSEIVFDIAQVYYAYESGNFMGRMADKMGLSYGHRGLYLQVPLSYFGKGLPDHEYKEILISRDPEIIFHILGFDYERFKEGFRNFDDMSKWVAASRYFSPEVFAFESLNSINRTRNRKRPVYAAFVEWCQSQPKRQDAPSKERVRNIMVQMYPGVQAKIDELQAEVILNAERRAKFNGHLVKELLGLEGAALGDFIIAFKKTWANFDAYLDSHTKEEVIKDIRAIAQKIA